MSGLAGKTIVLGVTGGIAAFKSAELVRLLVKAGARVHVIMTEAAEAFITPLTLQTLSGHKVARSLLDLTQESEIGHIALADAADLIVVAPATADVIGRFAAGLADDMLTTVVLASRAPVLLAPAMNVNMWENPLVQANLERLTGGWRFTTVGPVAGPLACGWVGPGRLVEPAVIHDGAAALLAKTADDTGASGLPLAGKKVVVSAGGTREPLDGVRFIGNRSSGKMGFAMAAAAAELGAEVTLVAAPVSLPTPPRVVARRDVETALQMQAALDELALQCDVVVMTAAVADFRPEGVTAGKLSRREATAGIRLNLVPNPDILAGLGERRGGALRPMLVGFAAEMQGGEPLLERARAKLSEKGCDAIVANRVGGAEGAFDADDNEAVLVRARREPVRFERQPKAELARALWRELLRPSS